MRSLLQFLLVGALLSGVGCVGASISSTESPCTGGRRLFDSACRDQCISTCEQAGFSCEEGICLPCAQTQVGCLAAEGEVCALDTDCEQARCSNGYCCRTGTCCEDAEDCSTFSAAATCDSPDSDTSCQGTRSVAVCNNHVCASERVDDDSGCIASITHSCGAYVAIGCTGAADQVPPVCASSCDGPEDCSAGFFCDGDSCEPLSGTGNECLTAPCATDLQCDNDVCCGNQAATCCVTNAHCPSGLSCNTTTFQCNETCVNGTTGACANPTTTFCLGNACVAKRASGAGCTVDEQCQSASCTDGICCQVESCGACKSCTGANGICVAVADGNGPQCTSTSGQTCVSGACKSVDGLSCTNDDNCLSGACIQGTCRACSNYSSPCDSDGDCCLWSNLCDFSVCTQL